MQLSHWNLPRLHEVNLPSPKVIENEKKEKDDFLNWYYLAQAELSG